MTTLDDRDGVAVSAVGGLGVGIDVVDPVNPFALPRGGNKQNREKYYGSRADGGGVVGVRVTHYTHRYAESKFLEFDFDEMTVEEVSWVDMWEREFRSYLLRRSSSASWQMKHTPQSADDELAYDGATNSGYHCARIPSLTEWCDVDPAIVEAVESHYQQYLQSEK